MMRTKATYYFATKEDLICGISRFEEECDAKYIEVSFSDSQDIVAYESALFIPTLGVSLTGDHNHDTAYLIARCDASINIRSIPQARGGIKYAVDSVANPDTVTWWPGGLYEPSSCIIRGELNADSKDIVSFDIYKSFIMHVCNPLLKWKHYRLGANAIRLYSAGYRLNSSKSAPPATDLTIPDYIVRSSE